MSAADRAGRPTASAVSNRRRKVRRTVLVSLLLAVGVLVLGLFAAWRQSRIEGRIEVPPELRDIHLAYHFWTFDTGRDDTQLEREYWIGSIDDHLTRQPLLYWRIAEEDALAQRDAFEVLRNRDHNIVSIAVLRMGRPWAKFVGIKKPGQYDGVILITSTMPPVLWVE